METVARSIEYTLMDAVHSIATLYRCSPFDILQTDVEHFILSMNYLMEKGAGDNGRTETKVKGHDPFWKLL